MKMRWMRDDFVQAPNGSRWLNEAFVATWRRGKLWMGSAVGAEKSRPGCYEVMYIHFMHLKRLVEVGGLVLAVSTDLRHLSGWFQTYACCSMTHDPGSYSSCLFAYVSPKIHMKPFEAQESMFKT